MVGERPMKYPYTLSAKIAQFPFKFYLNNNALWKYYFIAVAVSIPVFYKIQKLSYSPENVAKWAESRRKQAAEHH
ncbi:uncharacterized protein LOC113370411 [Ctenocephalides felis]|uniref:uncharacterized protein LOC113370411 n=1 Tax=Ctenocephalides felis TaxID=7515 RepID=UPI000E6E5583|nr:uncharacterized protein LOC113370411 [Ctenocephalides felis]